MDMIKLVLRNIVFTIIVEFKKNVVKIVRIKKMTKTMLSVILFYI